MFCQRVNIALFDTMYEFYIAISKLTTVQKTVSSFSVSLGSRRNKSTDLKAILAEKIPKFSEEVKKIRKQHGNVKLGEATVGQVYGGMRGLISLLSDTSELDPNKGITFRNYTIPQCREKLPKAPGGAEPLPEGVFWLMMTGDMPTEAQTKAISKEWAKRARLPKHVITLLQNLPTRVHPMTQLSAACTVLNSESKFLEAYNKGVPKSKYWEYVYEDGMDLIAKITTVSAIIYCNLYRNRKPVAPIDDSKDLTFNFTNMCGYDNPDFTELMRLYLTIHSDHENGNVSSHTTHLVNSALSDPFLSYAAGINGLAGPLHGLANQEVLVWIEKLRKELGDSVTTDQLKEFVKKTLKSGQVVPGYGHAVLRKTDPRYTVQREFALKHLPNDPTFQMVAKLFEVVPDILAATGKVKNPWPNVDAHSGALLWYYGMKEMNFYTVLFSISRAIGVMSSILWHRALGLPIERPKAISTYSLKKRLKIK